MSKHKRGRKEVHECVSLELAVALCKRVNREQPARRARLFRRRRRYGGVISPVYVVVVYPRANVPGSGETL